MRLLRSSACRPRSTARDRSSCGYARPHHREPYFVSWNRIGEWLRHVERLDACRPAIRAALKTRLSRSTHAAIAIADGDADRQLQQRFGPDERTNTAVAVHHETRPRRPLTLLAHMLTLVAGGKSQLIIATHSPILLPFRGAQILSSEPRTYTPCRMYFAMAATARSTSAIVL